MWAMPTFTEMGKKNAKENEKKGYMKTEGSTPCLFRGEGSLFARPLENLEVGLRTLKLNFVGEPSRKFASTKSNTPIDSCHRETQ